MNEIPKSDIVIYRTDDNSIKINVRLEDENIWLSQQQMAELYQSSRSNVVEHIKHIYEEGELSETSTCRNFRQVQIEGNRSVEREIPFYNLDMIISLGYRIKSHIATQFRIWATERLKEYIEHLDNILKATGTKLLSGAGSVSHKQAMEKAEKEYRKYQAQTLSSVEKAYLESIKTLEKKTKRATKKGGKNE